MLAQGQAPVTIKSLLNQRARWGRGCVDTFRQEPILFSKHLSFAQKASYLASYAFWWNYLRRFVYLCAPIVTILFNLMVLRDNPTWLVLAFWLPYYLLFNRSLRVMSSDMSNQHWNSVADTVLFPYLIGPIIAEQLGLKQKKFVITEKRVMGNRARATFVFGLPHLVFLVAMVAAIVVVIARSISSGSIYNPIILFWLIIGAKNLIFALFFMWGRDNFRLASRFYFTDPITVAGDGGSWTATTSDASETGFSYLAIGAQEELTTGSFDETLFNEEQLEPADPYSYSAYSVYMDGGAYYQRVITNNLRPDAPKVLFIHDNSALPFAAFSALGFGETHMYWPELAPAGDGFTIANYVEDNDIDYVFFLTECNYYAMENTFAPRLFVRP